MYELINKLFTHKKYLRLMVGLVVYICSVFLLNFLAPHSTNFWTVAINIPLFIALYFMLYDYNPTTGEVKISRIWLGVFVICLIVKIWHLAVSY